MFNPFIKKFHPFMDADTGVGGGVADPQPTGPIEESTEPAGEPTGGEPGEESSSADPASQKQVQTPEQNKAFAELRRRADAAEQARQRDISIAKKYGKEYDVFSESDIAERYGQHGIKTLAEFEAALQREQARERGIDPDLINQLVSSHPDVQMSRQLKEELTQQQAQIQLNSEVEELAAEYPDLQIKTLADLQKISNYDAIIQKAQKGNTLLEAYVLVNHSEIRKQAKEQGAQQTIRNISSKSHLGTEKSGNQPQGKEVELSPEQLRVWKGMGYSDAEARKRASKYLKK